MYLTEFIDESYIRAAKIAGVVALLYLSVFWLALIFWTYRDIGQRSRNLAVQGASVLMVTLFFVPGLWVYLMLRPRYTLVQLFERSLEEEAFMQELEVVHNCPKCRRRVNEDFLICPSCTTALKESCTSCSKPLSYAWIACPYCQVQRTPRVAAPMRVPSTAPGAVAEPVPAPAGLAAAATGDGAAL